MFLFVNLNLLLRTHSYFFSATGTIVLGPWVSFQDYKNIFTNPRWNVTWLIKILFTVSEHSSFGNCDAYHDLVFEGHLCVHVLDH